MKCYECMMNNFPFSDLPDHESRIFSFDFPICKVEAMMRMKGIQISYFAHFFFVTDPDQIGTDSVVCSESSIGGWRPLEGKTWIWFSPYKEIY